MGMEIPLSELLPIKSKETTKETTEEQNVSSDVIATTKDIKDSNNEKEEEKFYGEETINGHKIICDYCALASSQGYEMHFPQIDFSSDEAIKEGVADQNLYISNEKKEAEFVFNKTIEWATKEDSIYDLFKKVEKLTQSLQ